MTHDRPVFIGVVAQGKVRLDWPKQLAAYVTRFEGDEIELEIRKRRSKRSHEANAYWWAVVVPAIAEYTGYTRDETHEALKAKFLGTEDMSHGLLRIGSTAKLNTLEFADLVDKVILWAAEELGVVIPLPDPKWREAARKAKAA